MENIIPDNGTFDLLVNLVAMLLGLLLSTQVGQTIWRWVLAYRRKRRHIAVRLLEAGVIYVFQYIYDEVLRSQEECNETGHKFTKEQAKQLRNAAVTRAIEISCSEYGKDLVSEEVPVEELDAVVEKIVADTKRRLGLN